MRESLVTLSKSVCSWYSFLLREEKTSWPKPHFKEKWTILYKQLKTEYCLTSWKAPKELGILHTVNPVQWPWQTSLESRCKDPGKLQLFQKVGISPVEKHWYIKLKKKVQFCIPFPQEVLFSLHLTKWLVHNSALEHKMGGNFLRWGKHRRAASGQHSNLLFEPRVTNRPHSSGCCRHKKQFSS